MSEIVMEEEEEVIELDHWIHKHPLTLVATSREDDCYGCWRKNFSSGERGYGCKNKSCGDDPILLHEECAEMARNIRHPMHAQHILEQRVRRTYGPDCAICEQIIWGLCYSCEHYCKFNIHIGCALAQGRGVINDEEQNRRRCVIKHPSHLEHELRLLRRCSFRCDACGTDQIGDSYLCTVCEYWIHRKCASLPDTIRREDHHHSLSLSYVVHIKCAFKKSPHAIGTNIANASYGKYIIQFPVNNLVEVQIRPFVMKLVEEGIMPPVPDDNDDGVVNVKYDKVCYHKHQLSLISSPPSNDDGQTKEENRSDDDDDEDDDCIQKSKLICDGCITPISQRKHMSCSECKYHLHWECFHLPPQLPSLPLIHEPDHQLLLQSYDKLEYWRYCNVCHLATNGLFYVCTKCDFKADIKCASLPLNIHHSAHPRLLKLITDLKLIPQSLLQCAAGCDYEPFQSWYMCETCEFMLHVECAILPPLARNRTWDNKHMLPLTYDANVNHPDEFCCDHCEEQMNPKMWMYHCRPCDLSFHPKCIPDISGKYRNFKFGQRYENVAAHPHPLTFQLLTTKRGCDGCRLYMVNEPGFHCASCNFFICLTYCHRKMCKDDGSIQAVD
ncbi:hypothetical protein C2S53_001162 [Perilla frutescens var. hirtella]|uniref:DC1 domain-containing protein n=1 Tax=Perilla frutescens var. hirtella TaxID=608512 RepID=A0AAD4JLZ5_PERFH|nr:hypothetical protein C2S53_001162 [Perilla frutescens var. hirtella]